MCLGITRTKHKFHEFIHSFQLKLSSCDRKLFTVLVFWCYIMCHWDAMMSLCWILLPILGRYLLEWSCNSVHKVFIVLICGRGTNYLGSSFIQSTVMFSYECFLCDVIDHEIEFILLQLSWSSCWGAASLALFFGEVGSWESQRSEKWGASSCFTQVC